MGSVKHTAPKQAETKGSSIATGKSIVMMRGIFNQQETQTHTHTRKRKTNLFPSSPVLNLIWEEAPALPVFTYYMERVTGEKWPPWYSTPRDLCMQVDDKSYNTVRNLEDTHSYSSKDMITHRALT